MSIQSWELNGNGETPSRAMTLVPHPRRDSRHGTAGRIASWGEQDVLTRVGESGIVGTVARMQDRPGGRRSEPPGRSPEPVTRLSPDQRWLPSWYGVRRLTAGMEELADLAGARFLTVFEAGQIPRQGFLETLLPYFADRKLALVQASYSRSGRRRSHIRDAVFRGADALGEAPCLGSNYVLRRSALHSVGGFGPAELTLAGSLRRGKALKADRWRTRYLSGRVVESLGDTIPTSRLADYWRWTAAELA